MAITYSTTHIFVFVFFPYTYTCFSLFVIASLPKAGVAITYTYTRTLFLYLCLCVLPKTMNYKPKTLMAITFTVARTPSLSLPLYFTKNHELQTLKSLRTYRRENNNLIRYYPFLFLSLRACRRQAWQSHSLIPTFLSIPHNIYRKKYCWLQWMRLPRHFVPRSDKK